MVTEAGLPVTGFGAAAACGACDELDELPEGVELLEPFEVGEVLVGRCESDGWLAPDELV